jgi:DNA-binding MarR family transcriptional regulator
MGRVMNAGPKNPTQRYVLLILADRADDEGGSLFPSVVEISRKTALSQRTVIRAIDGLVQEGYLKKRRRRNVVNTYQIVVSALTEKSESLQEVTDCHIGKCQNGTSHSDNMTSLEVTERQSGSDNLSPDPSLIRHYNRQARAEGESGASAPRPTPLVSHVQFDRTPGNGKGYALPAEPPISPPAARLMQQLTGRYPGAGNVDYIAERLGDCPDEAALAYVVREWLARGFKANNYVGMCDWYDERRRNPQWTPPRNGAAKTTAQHSAPVSVSRPTVPQPVTY